MRTYVVTYRYSHLAAEGAQDEAEADADRASEGGFVLASGAAGPKGASDGVDWCVVTYSYPTLALYTCLHTSLLVVTHDLRAGRRAQKARPMASISASLSAIRI